LEQAAHPQSDSNLTPPTSDFESRIEDLKRQLRQPRLLRRIRLWLLLRLRLRWELWLRLILWLKLRIQLLRLQLQVRRSSPPCPALGLANATCITAI
jgi:hypothetical protein